MTSTLLLAEHQSAVVELPAPVAADLAAADPRALSVNATGTVGRWMVSASSYVGSIVHPLVEVLIRPKIGIENLLVLLDGGMPAESWRPEVFGYAADDHLLPAFAAFFARTLDKATASGLVRSYRADEDRLLALRGRIDFPEQLRHPGLPSPIACRFDEYTADVVENRYLLGVTDRLLRMVGVAPHTRSLLQHTRGRFEGVQSVLPSVEQLESINLSRLNEHYRPVLRLCRFVIENLTLADRFGATSSSSFLLDMNRLFEDWVTRRLGVALRSRLAVVGQAGIHLDVRNKVAITPDLLFYDRDRIAYVGDVKYKLSSSGVARSSDYYQLLAYCTALGLNEGLLIYAQTEGAAPEQEVVVRHANTRLWTYRLDLSGSVHDLDASVNQLANWLDHRAR